MLKWTLGDPVASKPFYEKHKKAVTTLVLSPDESFVVTGDVTKGQGSTSQWLGSALPISSFGRGVGDGSEC